MCKDIFSRNKFAIFVEPFHELPCCQTKFLIIFFSCRAKEFLTSTERLVYIQTIITTQPLLLNHYYSTITTQPLLLNHYYSTITTQPLPLLLNYYYSVINCLLATVAIAIPYMTYNYDQNNFGGHVYCHHFINQLYTCCNTVFLNCFWLGSQFACARVCVHP